MTQSSQDWTKIAGVIATGVSLVATYTAYMFKQRLDNKEDQIAQKTNRIGYLEADLSRQEKSYERRIKELEQELEKSEERQRDAYDTLRETLDGIDKNSLSSQDLVRVKKIVSLLERLKDTDIQETLNNYKSACKWLRYRRDAWAAEASQNIFQKSPDIPSCENVNNFQRDLRGYLDWIISCMQVGHTQNNPLENFVASPSLKSPYPYVEAIRYIQRKEDWGDLKQNQITCLSDFLEKLIERLNESINF